jgi:hypothetical protein
VRAGREETALRERTEQARRARDMQLREASHSLLETRREESLRVFQSLLVEHVRSHEVCGG